MSEKIVVYLSADEYDFLYQSVKRIFGIYVPNKTNIRHIIIAPSKNVTEVNHFRKEKIDYYVIPKKGTETFKELIANYITFHVNLNKILKTLFNKFDVKALIVRDDPMMAHIGYNYATKYNIGYLYQISHLKEEELLETVQESKRLQIKTWMMGKVGLLIRNFYLKKADAILPISKQMSYTLSLLYKISRSKMYPLPEGIEPIQSEILKNKTEIRNKIRRHLHIKNTEFVICYLGTLNPYRKHEVMLKAVEKVMEKDKNIKLLIIGGPKSKIEEKFINERIKSSKFSDRYFVTGLINHDEVINYLFAADLGLSLFRETPVLINNSPIKILEYLNAQLPVIATDIPEQYDTIIKSNSGLICEFNVDSIAQSISKVVSFEDNKLREMANKGKEYVNSFRNFEKLSETVIDLYKELNIIEGVK